MAGEEEASRFEQTVSKFFLNDELYIEDGACTFDGQTLKLVGGDKVYELAVDDISFTGQRQNTVILCQISQDDEDETMFDDLAIELQSSEAAGVLMKQLEDAINAVALKEDINMDESSDDDEEQSDS